MSAIPVVIVPGAAFQQQVEGLRDAVKGTLATPGASFAIAKIFTFIQLAPGNQVVQQKLVARGDFATSDNRTYRNQGSSINERVQDIGPNLQGLQLYIGRKVTLDITLDEDALVFVPVDDTRVMVTFDEPPLPGLATTFLLERIRGELAAWRYLFQDEIEPANKVEIVVDLTLQAVASARRASNFRGLDKPILVLDATRTRSDSSPCQCCKGFETAPQCPPPGWALSFDLHSLIVVSNASQFAQMSQDHNASIAASTPVFAGFGVTLVDMGTNMILDPLLTVINPNPCTTQNMSPDTAALYAAHYPQGLGPHAVVAFVVTTLTGAADGCASHPVGQAGLMVESNPQTHVLSHELGHDFGLRHVPNNANMMFCNSPHTGVVDAGQIATMRCSPIMEALAPGFVASAPSSTEASEEHVTEPLPPMTTETSFREKFEATEPVLPRLATYGKAALPLLEEYFSGDRVSWAARAVRVAAMLDGDAGRSLLERAALDQRMEVRAALAAALSEATIRDNGALTGQLLAGPEPGIRRLAIQAASGQEMRALLPELEELRDADPYPALRELAARAADRMRQ